jgi:predicted site-specific integrase-resolvase
LSDAQFLEKLCALQCWPTRQCGSAKTVVFVEPEAAQGNRLEMKIGYARVSTEGQNLDLQRHALNSAGCERIFEDHGFSGAKALRPGLRAALRSLRPSDTLVVWRFDRLARSVPHLATIISNLQKRG